MKKVLIVEDEEHVSNHLKDLLATNFKETIHVLGVCDSIKNSVTKINLLQPDILLLDIEIKDGVSFEIFDQVNHDAIELVFITGYNSRAIEAIKLGALDYLLKPVDSTEFVTAVDKAIKVIDEKRVVDRTKMTDVAQSYYLRNENEKIILRTAEAIHLVAIIDILYCKSEGNYTTFFLKDNRQIMISKPMKYSHSLLPRGDFIKCHKSYVVNKSAIETYIKSGDLLLTDGSNIPVSGTNREFVLGQLFK